MDKPQITSYTPEMLLKDNLHRGVKRDILQKQVWEIYLKKHKVDVLHYMVHRRNVGSIFESGILSFNKISEVFRGRERIDDMEVQGRRSHRQLPNGKSVHDYVPLYFCTKTAMQRVKTHKGPKREVIFKPSDIVFIDIATDVLLQDGVCFSDGNAASEITKFYNKPEELDKINWHGMRLDPRQFRFGEDEWYRIRMAEVLVPNIILTCYFTRVVCFSSKVQNELKELASKHKLKMPIDKDGSEGKFINGRVPMPDLKYYFDDDLEVPE